MNTPICDFVKKYAKSSSLRLHMPGHKGAPVLGIESLDITEFDGADSLYEAKGIIKESEENASRLFSASPLDFNVPSVYPEFTNIPKRKGITEHENARL